MRKVIWLLLTCYLHYSSCCPVAWNEFLKVFSERLKIESLNIFMQAINPPGLVSNENEAYWVTRQRKHQSIWFLLPDSCSLWYTDKSLPLYSSLKAYWMTLVKNANPLEKWRWGHGKEKTTFRYADVENFSVICERWLITASHSFVPSVLVFPTFIGHIMGTWQRLRSSQGAVFPSSIQHIT